MSDEQNGKPPSLKDALQQQVNTVKTQTSSIIASNDLITSFWGPVAGTLLTAKVPSDNTVYIESSPSYHTVSPYTQSTIIKCPICEADSKLIENCKFCGGRGSLGIDILRSFVKQVFEIEDIKGESGFSQGVNSILSAIRKLPQLIAEKRALAKVTQYTNNHSGDHSHTPKPMGSIFPPKISSKLIKYNKPSSFIDEANLY